MPLPDWFWDRPSEEEEMLPVPPVSVVTELSNEVVIGPTSQATLNNLMGPMTQATLKSLAPPPVGPLYGPIPLETEKKFAQYCKDDARMTMAMMAALYSDNPIIAPIDTLRMFDVT